MRNGRSHLFAAQHLLCNGVPELRQTVCSTRSPSGTKPLASSFGGVVRPFASVPLSKDAQVLATIHLHGRAVHGLVGPPFFPGAGSMAKDDSNIAVTEENRRLREALRECRELLKRTEDLLQRAQKSGSPTAES